MRTFNYRSPTKAKGGISASPKIGQKDSSQRLRPRATGAEGITGFSEILMHAPRPQFVRTADTIGSQAITSRVHH